jgi:hypothetical protein
MLNKTPHPPTRRQRFNRGWLMRHSPAWAVDARMLLASPLRRRSPTIQPVPVRVGREIRPQRVSAL